MNQKSEHSTLKIYLADILYLHDTPKRLNPILQALLSEKTSGGRLVLNAAVKREIAQKIKLSVSTVNNGLTVLVKGGILIREDKGLYRFNSDLFGWDNWEDIHELRLNLIYDARGRSLETHEAVEPEAVKPKKETILERIKRKQEATK